MSLEKVGFPASAAIAAPGRASNAPNARPRWSFVPAIMGSFVNKKFGGRMHGDGRSPASRPGTAEGMPDVSDAAKSLKSLKIRGRLVLLR
jgi:hypothetical protein